MTRYIAAGLVTIVSAVHAQFESRNEVSYRQAFYNEAFFWRHNETFRNSAAIHYAHAKAHDVLQLTSLADAAAVDAKTDADFTGYLLRHRARTEPTMEYYGPYTARFAWKLYRAIDWTHIHHEQTYDIMSDRDISWARKQEITDRAVRYYLDKNTAARSCAPLDVTMRRAATMMKPYFGFFRNKYPRANNFFYAAHWWHPAIYEAQMLGGNGRRQDEIVRATDEVFYSQVLKDRPQRMLLSREVMPRYSRMSAESANIFDNLHMLHGIAYDILAFEGWSVAEKRAELYRVIDAMSYHAGDEKMARKFKTLHPDVDPRRYEDWMRGFDGEMNRIMMEMHEEMMPMHMPEGKSMPAEKKEQIQAQLRMKLTPGIQTGEIEGSWHDAMMKLMPAMKMDPESMKPGRASSHMVEMMLKGWREKYGNIADIDRIPMEGEPELSLQPSTAPR